MKPATGRTEGRTVRADLLSRGGMSGAPVVTKDGDLCGIIVRLEGSPLVDGSLRTVARMISPGQIKRMKEIERENARLKKAVADLTLDKVILKETLEGNH